MARGINRKIDELGRICIPIEHRRATSIKTTEPLDLCLDGTTLRLRKGSGRKLDELGRYTIPMEIRKRFGWSDRQELEIYTEGNEICIRKSAHECQLCGSEHNLIEVDNVRVCMVCAKKIVNVMGR